jgi:hypothetical protein
MAARQDNDLEDARRATAVPDDTRIDPQSAVERSLEEFIARANSTLPLPSGDAAAQVRAISTPRKAKRGGTLVVLGPVAPLAEETEIVTRLPGHELVPSRRSGWSSLRLGVAFLAGAAIVLVATRLISGGPRPVKPTAPVVAAPAVAPIIVVPIPTAELPPPAEAEPAPAPPPAEVVAAPAPPPAKRTARKPPRERVAAPRAAAKTSGGLVDPFAN